MINGGEFNSRWSAEWKLIYSVIVAGKSAKFTDRAMRLLIYDGPDRDYPFDQLRGTMQNGGLEEGLRQSRTGNYRKFLKCFPQLVKLDAETCTVEELETIHGIGFKTSRFFLLWTRPGVRYAALDTHVMKFLRRLGYTKNKATPGSSTAYQSLEKIFLEIANKVGRSAREFDFAIWDSYSKGEEDALFEILETYGIKESPKWRRAEAATRK